eukprot:2165752-Amphidinium_carterae.2
MMIIVLMLKREKQTDTGSKLTPEKQYAIVPFIGFQLKSTLVALIGGAILISPLVVDAARIVKIERPLRVTLIACVCKVLTVRCQRHWPRVLIALKAMTCQSPVAWIFH